MAGRPASRHGASRIQPLRNVDGAVSVEPTSTPPDLYSTVPPLARILNAVPDGPAGDKQMSAWVEAAQAGDREAFQSLVAATYRDVFTLALRLCRSEDDALDVAQEAYLRGYRSIGKFRGDAKFSTWMYRITSN